MMHVLSGEVCVEATRVVGGTWCVGECPEEKRHHTSRTDLQQVIETETILVVERHHCSEFDGVVGFTQVERLSLTQY